MSTWQERLKEVVGGAGYDITMRRSIQTIVLYEAKRCTDGRINSLRPFQKRAVFMETAAALLDSLDFIYPHQKPAIFWRTATSKESLDSEIAWKKVKGVEKELDKLSEKIKKHLAPRRPHQEAVDLLVQELFEELNENNRGKHYPAGWEHSHNHVIMALRLYYREDRPDPTFPAPVCPREITPPIERPKPKNPPASSSSSSPPSPPPPAHNSIQLATAAAAAVMNAGSGSSYGAAAAPAVGKGSRPQQQQQQHVSDEFDEPTMDVAEILGETKNPVEDRRKVLQEVREHLDLLKEFEGVIPDEEIARRKRDLFLALPPAPPVPPAGAANKKQKV